MSVLGLVREYVEQNQELVNRIARQLAGDYDWRGAIPVVEKSGLEEQVNREMTRLGYALRCIEDPIAKRYIDDEQESNYTPTGSATSEIVHQSREAIPVFASDAIETSKWYPLADKATFDRAIDAMNSSIGGGRQTFVVDLVRDFPQFLGSFESEPYNATDKYAWELRKVDQLRNLYVYQRSSSE